MPPARLLYYGGGVTLLIRPRVNLVLSDEMFKFFENEKPVKLHDDLNYRSL